MTTLDTETQTLESATVVEKVIKATALKELILIQINEAEAIMIEPITSPLNPPSNNFKDPKIIKTSGRDGSGSGPLKKRKQVSRRLSKIKYEEKVLEVQRVTKVVKGGKKMSFRASVVVGDNKQKVGVGIGRAEDVSLAIEKAVLNGRKNLISVPLTIFLSVPHAIQVSYGASEVMLRPASLGTGIIAGGSIRPVLELGGIKNIVAKQVGANSLLNNAKATILALKKLNEKIDLGKAQLMRKQIFYNQLLKKQTNKV